MVNYDVVDKNGKCWGTYQHRDAAEREAMRNNEDVTPEIDRLAPFDVAEWED